MTKSYLVRASRIEFTNKFDTTQRHDLYCVIWIGGSKVNTKILESAGKYPHWDQPYQLDVNGTHQTITVEVFESIGRVDNALLGKGTTTVGALLQTQTGAWISIMGDNGLIGTFILGCQPMPDPILAPSSTDVIRSLPSSPKSSDGPKTIELQVRSKEKEITQTREFLENESPTKLKSIQRLIQDLCSTSFSGVSGFFGKNKPMSPLTTEKLSKLQALQAKTRQESLKMSRANLNILDQANKSSSEDSLPELIIPID